MRITYSTLPLGPLLKGKTQFVYRVPFPGPVSSPDFGLIHREAIGIQHGV